VAGTPGIDEAGIQAALADCRQGDVIAISRADHFGLAATPLNGVAVSAPFTPDLVALRCECEAVVVISQTCEVVAPIDEQPFIEVAPLVRLEGDIAGLARKNWSPRYAPLPAMGDDAFVDLDFHSRLEKTVVVNAARQRGCPTDAVGRRFGRHVGHKYSRPAFPEDVVVCFRDMVNRIKGKIGKDSDEGRRADILEDVRVLISPDFWAVELSLFFYFVLPPLDEGIGFAPVVWDEQVDDWLDRCTLAGRVQAIDGMPITLDVMTAETLEDSDSVIQAEVISP